jgi:hypothetical protein
MWVDKYNKSNEWKYNEEKVKTSVPIKIKIQ